MQNLFEALLKYMVSTWNILDSKMNMDIHKKIDFKLKL